MKTASSADFKTKATQKRIKKLVLGLDIDGCFACDFFFPGLLKQQPFFQSCMQKILNEVDVYKYGEIIICPATNRKDNQTDQKNARKHQTPTTHEVLSVVQRHLMTILEHSDCLITLDSRLLTERLFPMTFEHQEQTYEVEVANKIQEISGHTLVAPAEENGEVAGYYSRKSPEADEKCDIVLSLAWDYQDCADEITLVIIDDRFHETEGGLPVSLHDLTNFLSEHAWLLPSNVQTVFMKLDPFDVRVEIDERSGCEREFSMNCLSTMNLDEIEDLFIQVAKTIQHLGLSVDESEDSLARLQDFLSCSEEVDEGYAFQSVEDTEKYRLVCEKIFIEIIQDNPLRQTAFEHDRSDKRLEMMNSLSATEAEQYRNQIVEKINCIQGQEKDTYQIDSPEFWSNILVPAAEQYRRYVAYRHQDSSDLTKQMVFNMPGI